MYFCCLYCKLFQSCNIEVFLLPKLLECPVEWIIQLNKRIMFNKLTRFCTCCRVALCDGTILAYTDYDKDLIVDGLTYRANKHFNYSNIARSGLLQTDGMQIESSLSNEEIKEIDITTGKYDNAQIEIFYVDYNSYEKNTLLFGTIGKIKILNNRFVCEVNNLLQKTQRRIVKSFSPSCRATFCDHLCKLSKKDFTQIGTVVDVIRSKSKFIALGLHPGKNYYKHGLLTFLNGRNKKIAVEIKSSIDNEVELFLELPYGIQKNDQYSIILGCDKLFTTCSNKFNNTINFRGEPHIPGLQKLYRSIEGEI